MDTAQSKNPFQLQQPLSVRGINDVRVPWKVSELVTQFDALNEINEIIHSSCISAQLGTYTCVGWHDHQVKQEDCCHRKEALTVLVVLIISPTCSIPQQIFASLQRADRFLVALLTIPGEVRWRWHYPHSITGLYQVRKVEVKTVAEGWIINWLLESSSCSACPPAIV